jgi:hypothetical protein
MVSLTTTSLNATTPTLAINLGAGNDVFTLNAGANGNANAVNITLGTGTTPWTWTHCLTSPRLRQLTLIW